MGMVQWVENPLTIHQVFWERPFKKAMVNLDSHLDNDSLEYKADASSGKELYSGRYVCAPVSRDALDTMI